MNTKDLRGPFKLPLPDIRTKTTLRLASLCECGLSL